MYRPLVLRTPQQLQLQPQQQEQEQQQQHMVAAALLHLVLVCARVRVRAVWCRCCRGSGGCTSSCAWCLLMPWRPWLAHKHTAAQPAYLVCNRARSRWCSTSGERRRCAGAAAGAARGAKGAPEWRRVVVCVRAVRVCQSLMVQGGSAAWRCCQ